MSKDRYGRQVARALDEYFAAWRWRRSVERELRAVELTLPQWLVLEACAELHAEHDEPLNQRAIASHLELDPMTVSQVMKNLVARGLVDRTTDASGRAYRVVVTKKGSKTLSAALTRVEAGTRATERGRGNSDRSA